MRNYISELNTGTMEELRNEILLESRKYDPSIFNLSFMIDLEFMVINSTNEPSMVISLVNLYNSIEKLGVLFNEDYIDLWLSLFKDFCIEMIINTIPTSD